MSRVDVSRGVVPLLLFAALTAGFDVYAGITLLVAIGVLARQHAERAPIPVVAGGTI